MVLPAMDRLVESKEETDAGLHDKHNPDCIVPIIHNLGCLFKDRATYASLSQMTMEWQLVRRLNVQCIYYAHQLNGQWHSQRVGMPMEKLLQLAIIRSSRTNYILCLGSRVLHHLMRYIQKWGRGSVFN